MPNEFRKTWRSLTELGQEFGVSAVKFGKLLKQHGLKEEDDEPSQTAKEGELFKKITPKKGKPYYLWHHNKTVKYLTCLGVKKSGISEDEAMLNTEARKLAKSYLEARKLDDEGSEFGFIWFCESKRDIRKIGLDRFNKELKSLGFKGEPVTLEESW